MITNNLRVAVEAFDCFLSSRYVICISALRCYREIIPYLILDMAIGVSYKINYLTRGK